MDDKIPEDKREAMNPPYHTHICMMDVSCLDPTGDMRRIAPIGEETIEWILRCAAVNMLTASLMTILAIVHNF